MVVESEKMSDVPFTNLRFSTPMRLGLFVYGAAPEARDAPVDEDVELDLHERERILEEEVGSKLGK